jgi:hypothetical protein
MILAEALLTRGMALNMKESEARIANGAIAINGEICTDQIADVSIEDDIIEGLDNE